MSDILFSHAAAAARNASWWISMSWSPFESAVRSNHSVLPSSLGFVASGAVIIAGGVGGDHYSLWVAC